MSQVIPEQWAKATLDDIGQIQTGNTPSKKNPEYYGGLFPIFKPTDLNSTQVITKAGEYLSDEGKSVARRISANSTYVTCIGATIGKTGFVAVEGTCNQQINTISPYEGINPKWVYYWLISPNMNYEIISNSSSTTLPIINKSRFSNLSTLLPPLAEQKVIADKLDELLAQVESTKARLDAIPAILKSFRQSLLAAAVSGKLTEEWRDNQVNLPSHEKLLAAIKMERFERWVTSELEKRAAKGIKSKDDKWKDKYPEPISYYSDPLNRTNINDIPDHWLKTNLDTVSILTTGKTPSTTNEANWNGNLPFISPAQVHKNGHILEPARYVSELGAKTVPVVVKDSILIVCIGTVGKVGILDSDAVINQQLNAITPLPMVLSNYMFYWSKILYPWIIETSRATVNAAIINKSRLSEAPFALPSLEEQTEIVRRVEELFAFADKVEAQVNAAQLRVNNLTQSILAKAFRGELTADWRAANPELISGDNSAEALLKRIKAEREALAVKKKPVKKTNAKQVTPKKVKSE